MIYYNEFDGHAAQWLRNLISAGMIAPGEVDERDIRDVRASELAGFVQCHFFAGIGVWSYALRKAGWQDDRPVWTFSCPCQPLSSAGQRKGHADERHLWPFVQRLIAERKPATCFGEQVASKDGREWFSAIRFDLEQLGYAIGAADLAAASVGAPHIRQRLFFVADSRGIGVRRRSEYAENPGTPKALSGEIRQQRFRSDLGSDSSDERVADAQSQRLLGRPDDGDGRRRERASGQGCEARELADAARGGFGEQQGETLARSSGHVDGGLAINRPGPTNGYWRDADWLGCTDGKWRPVEPGTFPLVDGASFRMGSGSPFAGKSRAKMLKGYGNAINAEVAAAFIGAAMELEP